VGWGTLKCYFGLIGAKSHLQRNGSVKPDTAIEVAREGIKPVASSFDSLLWIFVADKKRTDVSKRGEKGVIKKMPMGLV
jgi:hypothetical protein